eukprot:145945_1
MWVKSNVTIPRMIDESAVGFYADEIYIFGGIGYAQQIIRYNFTRNEFIDDGTELLSVGTRGIAQFYDQSGDTMYFNTVQTLHLLSTNWTLSYMNTARHSSSCEIDRDR